MTKITTQMLQNLSAPKDLESNGMKLATALQCLNIAAKLLDKQSLSKEAEDITSLIEKLATKV
jgi:hypothetical protein